MTPSTYTLTAGQTEAVGQLGLTVAQVEAFEYELARCYRTLGALELLGGRDDAAAAELHGLTVRFGELLAGRVSQ